MHWYTEHLSYILSYLWVCFDLQFISMFILHWCQIVHLISKKDLSYSHTFVNLKVSSSTDISVYVLHQSDCVRLTSKILCLSYIKVTMSGLHWCPCFTLMLANFSYTDGSVLYWCQCVYSTLVSVSVLYSGYGSPCVCLRLMSMPVIYVNVSVIYWC